MNNPLDEFVTIGPADGAIQYYCLTIPPSGLVRFMRRNAGTDYIQLPMTLLCRCVKGSRI